MIYEKTASDVQRALVMTYPLYPLFDIEEDESNYLLYFDGRAIVGSEITIELEDDELIIKGKGSIEAGNGLSPKNLIISSHGKSISSQYKDGILMVTVLKIYSKILH